MPSQQVRVRQQKLIGYNGAGQVASEELSRGMVYRELALRLTGQLDATTAQNVAADVEIGGAWGAVRRIEVVANGADVLFSMSGAALLRANQWWFGRLPGESAAIAPLVGAGGADPTIDSVLILPFWMPHARRPIDTALDSRRLSNLQIRITWGSFDDVVSSSTAWIVEPSLEISSVESFGLRADAEFSEWRRFTIEKSITSTNSRMQIALPVNFLYRGFYLQSIEDGAESSAPINNVRLVSGTTVFLDLPAEVIRQHARLRNGFNPVPFNDGDNADAGWLYYDHVMDGMLTEGIDTIGYSEFFLELDVTAGTDTLVRVYPQQIIPLRDS